MKKSLLIQALMAVAYASNASAAPARQNIAPAPMTKTCSCCKATINALDVDHVSHCRHLAMLKGEPTGADDDLN